MGPSWSPLLPVVPPVTPLRGRQAKPRRGGEQRWQQGNAEPHALGTPGSPFASLHLEHLQSIFFVNKCKSASGESPLSGLVLHQPEFLPGVEEGLRKPLPKRVTPICSDTAHKAVPAQPKLPFSLALFLIGQGVFWGLFLRVWSGSHESFHPTARGLSEALGQCGIWRVNHHTSTLPKPAARGKPCLAPALRCVQTSKPKPAVDLITSPPLLLPESGSDLLCRCCPCSSQKAPHRSPTPGNTSRNRRSHQSRNRSISLETNIQKYDCKSLLPGQAKQQAFF